MKPYHKIQTVYKRDPGNKYKTLLEGEWALPEFEYLSTNKWTFTEKVDGTNIRVDWNCAEQVRFGGKTDRAQIPVFLLDKLQDLFPPAKFGVLYPDTPMTLYGEGYGARIQKGGGNYISDGVSFILFDVRIGDFWLQHSDVKDIATQLMIDTVPIIGTGTLLDAVEIVRKGFKSEIGTQVAEGLVMRPEVELFARNGQRIIAKVKHKDF